MHRSQALAAVNALAAARVAVAGTHGKTTTTSMLTVVPAGLRARTPRSRSAGS
jgi:UDP-N-acetylmuramate-alanine ligase